MLDSSIVIISFWVHFKILQNTLSGTVLAQRLQANVS
uniref:Uncharacterized protein n=1 Tax=Rhizophora mucronata TaxID=61149 RepID=A0A2P2KIC7_RHIMU